MQTCHGMAIVVVSLHTQCRDEYGDFGKIWKVFGKHLGGVLSTCFDPRTVSQNQIACYGVRWTGRSGARRWAP